MIMSGACIWSPNSPFCTCACVRGLALTSAAHRGRLPNVPLAAARRHSISRAELLTLSTDQAGVKVLDTMCSPPDQTNENCPSCAHRLRWVWAAAVSGFRTKITTVYLIGMEIHQCPALQHIPRVTHCRHDCSSQSRSASGWLNCLPILCDFCASRDHRFRQYTTEVKQPCDSGACCIHIADRIA